MNEDNIKERIKNLKEFVLKIKSHIKAEEELIALGVEFTGESCYSAENLHSTTLYKLQKVRVSLCELRGE